MDPLASCELYGPGYGCYTFLQYPEVPGCGFPESGALCAQASTGTQGDFCGEDLGNYCEPSYMCVVGALGGKRCAQICSVYGESGCPLGLLCGETDVPGYGVCF